MENCDTFVHLKDHNYSIRRRVSTRQVADAGRRRAFRKCPCCRDDQVQTSTPRPRRSATATSLPQKRKRSSVPRPSTSSAQPAKKSNLVQRPPSAISPADLPVVSDLLHSSTSSTANIQLSSTAEDHDSAVKIHNLSVEEYQQLYHEVVDDMLRYNTGQVHPYSLKLGLQIKQKLWERLNRPTITTSATQDGLVVVDISYGVGAYPPLHNVGTRGEPRPRLPPNKRLKN